MFDKQMYQETFSRVTASEETYWRVMNMAKERKVSKGRKNLFRAVVIAAIISMLVVTASAAEYMVSWFSGYFSDNNEMPLSSEQISYINENEQVINESQLQDEWMVELRSTMNDGDTAYIIIGVTAPKDVNLEPNLKDLGYMIVSTDRFELKGNDESGYGIISCSEKLFSVTDFRLAVVTPLQLNFQV